MPNPIDEAAAALTNAGFAINSDEVIVAGDWQGRPIASTAKCLEAIRRGVAIDQLVTQYTKRAALYAALDELKHL